jgi:hypothetical protein
LQYRPSCSIQQSLPKLPTRFAVRTVSLSILLEDIEVSNARRKKKQRGVESALVGRTT